MSRRLFIAGCLLAFALSPVDGTAQRAKQKELKEFYVDIDAVSDAGPFWFKYVLHVEPVADGTRVRYIRAAPPDAQCQETVTLKAAEALLKDTQVWEVPGKLNLCSFTEDEVDAAIKPYRYRGVASIWDTAAYGIVLKCGSSEKLLRLPYSDEVDFDRLVKNEPKIGALYDLAGNVVRRAFDGKSPLHDLVAEQDVKVQERGKLVLEELRSGKFDRGFWKPGLGHRSKGQSMRTVLMDYRGIYVSARREGRLVDKQDLQFIKYVPAPYPQIAQMARIQGNVSLLVTASLKDGSVQEVKIVSGHPMLERSAVDAARQWVFQPGQEKLNAPIAVTLEFSFQCPKL